MAAQQSQRKITFKVHRATAFEDTYQQAAAQGLLSSSTGPCLLFPTFFEGLGQAEALESGEGHGPRKEYYGLIGRALCSTSDSVTPENALLSASGPQLFTYNQSAACYWFNTSLKCTVEHCGHYHCAGWLTGQVISNRAALGISLPALLFQKLLDGPKFKASLEALTAFDSTAAASLSKVASLDDAAFQTLLQVENAPPQLSREAYIEAGVQRLLVDSCTWQSGALAEGFWSAVSRPVLEAWRVTPTDLAQIVNGSSLSSDANFRVQDVFRVVLDEQLEGAAPQLLMALWQVLERWPVDMKRRFVRFVTACERVPLPGMEVLRIELPFVAYNEADHRRLLTMLPQAHTCANTLELPDYWNSLIKARGIADPFSLPADQLQDLQDELAEILPGAVSELDETSEDAVAAPIVTPPLSAKGRLPPIAAKPAWGEPSTVAGGWTGTPKAAWGAERLPAHPPLASLAAPFAAVKHASPPTSSAPDSEVKAVASVEVLSEHDGHEHPASDLATQMTSSALSSSPDPPSSPSVSNLSASPSVPLASSLHEAPHKPASSFGSPRSPIKHVEDTHLDSERLSDGFDSQSELSHAQLDSPDCLDHDLVPVDFVLETASGVVIGVLDTATGVVKSAQGVVSDALDTVATTVHAVTHLVGSIVSIQSTGSGLTAVVHVSVPDVAVLGVVSVTVPITVSAGPNGAVIIALGGIQGIHYPNCPPIDAPPPAPCTVAPSPTTPVLNGLLNSILGLLGNILGNCGLIASLLNSVLGLLYGILG
ncbi:hypothetical protein WJX72_005512 [[Myrmecia] bisecta]|uniref:HECT-type E3 ubiquitin transferase n=1 Tax=[Myrmecia] bisecta TaxID=41462 RepID=A0AAW1P6V7_9CHLO